MVYTVGYPIEALRSKAKSKCNNQKIQKTGICFLHSVSHRWTQSTRAAEPRRREIRTHHSSAGHRCRKRSCISSFLRRSTDNTRRRAQDASRAQQPPHTGGRHSHGAHRSNTVLASSRSRRSVTSGVVRIAGIFQQKPRIENEH